MTIPIKTRKQLSGRTVRLPAMLPNDKQVVDAAEQLQITLRQADINKGVGKDPTSCGFACALKRQYKVDAYVFRTRAFLDFGDKIVRFIVPPSTRTELLMLDRDGDMQPGVYWLSAPGKNQRLGARAAQPPNPGGKKSKGVRRPRIEAKNVRAHA